MEGLVYQDALKQKPQSLNSPNLWESSDSNCWTVWFWPISTYFFVKKSSWQSFNTVVLLGLVESFLSTFFVGNHIWWRRKFRGKWFPQKLQFLSDNQNLNFVWFFHVWLKSSMFPRKILMKYVFCFIEIFQVRDTFPNQIQWPFEKEILLWSLNQAHRHHSLLVLSIVEQTCCSFLSLNCFLYWHPWACESLFKLPWEVHYLYDFSFCLSPTDIWY